MNQYRYTRSAEIDLQVSPEGKLVLRFCDSQVAQWDEDFDDLSDWNDEDLRNEIETAIENAAGDLAASLVKDLRERVLAQPSIPTDGSE
jgi:hypothetical protein